jgi:hypothetical protein
MGFGRCSADIKKSGSPLGQKVLRATAALSKNMFDHVGAISNRSISPGYKMVSNLGSVLFVVFISQTSEFSYVSIFPSACCLILPDFFSSYNSINDRIRFFQRQAAHFLAPQKKLANQKIEHFRLLRATKS